MVVFLMGQIVFLRDEIKIKNHFIERLLTLKSVLHDNQLSSYNSQKINKKISDKNLDTDDIPVDYQSLTQNNNIDIIIKELNKSLSGIDKSNKAINNIVVKYPIINPVEIFYTTSENKEIDRGNLSQNIDFNIISTYSDKSHAEIKSGSEITLDETDKPPFDKVADNAINQLIVLIENMKSLQSKHKELFVTSKNEPPCLNQE